MPDKTWKRVEREIAAILGGERVPVSGRQRGDAPDIRHQWLSLEVKHRKTLPNWIFDALDQAQKSKAGQQLPVAILHGKGMGYKKSLVVIELDDFVDWFGGEI